MQRLRPAAKDQLFEHRTSASQRIRDTRIRRATIVGVTALGKKTDSQVVELYGEVMAELHRRGVVRSGNNPIADMAEHVIADYYGVEPEPPNTKSWDVTTKDGTRIQVKALRRTRASRRNLSAIRTLDFDVLAAVVFEVDMRLSEAIFVPIVAVREQMRWSNTWKANRISLTKRLLSDPRVRRIPADELVANAPGT
jgi:hypothetical protein